MGGVQRKIHRLSVFGENTLRYIALQGEISSWSLSECTCCAQVSFSKVSVLRLSVLRVISSRGCLVWEQKVVWKSFASLHAGVCARNLHRVYWSGSVGSIHDIYV